jgi:hypothetical protein
MGLRLFNCDFLTTSRNIMGTFFLYEMLGKDARVTLTSFGIR